MRWDDKVYAFTTVYRLRKLFSMLYQLSSSFKSLGILTCKAVQDASCFSTFSYNLRIMSVIVFSSMNDLKRVSVLQAKLEGSGELILIPIYVAVVVCKCFVVKKKKKKERKRERKRKRKKYSKMIFFSATSLAME